MNEERMKILEMVEDGKVSVEDALKLMDSLNNERRYGYRKHYEKPENAEIEEKIKKFAARADSFARDVGEKLEASIKHMEPKVKRATMVVAEKTARVVDELSRKLNDSLNNMREKEACREACREEAEEADCCCGGDEPGEN